MQPRTGETQLAHLLAAPSHEAATLVQFFSAQQTRGAPPIRPPGRRAAALAQQATGHRQAASGKRQAASGAHTTQTGNRRQPSSRLLLFSCHSQPAHIHSQQALARHTTTGRDHTPRGKTYLLFLNIHFFTALSLSLLSARLLTGSTTSTGSNGSPPRSLAGERTTRTNQGEIKCRHEKKQTPPVAQGRKISRLQVDSGRSGRSPAANRQPPPPSNQQ